MSKITVDQVRLWKGRKPRPLALTSYDYPMTRLLDEVGIEIIHVGDSLGMLVLGLPDTTEVTMADMLHHVRAVARAKPRALITADLSYRSYETLQEAVIHSKQLIAAGAEAIKMEGGQEIENQIRAVLDTGIPVQGHLGMLPQHVKEEGGYKRKGKTQQEQSRLIEDAMRLEQLGCFSLVLECVVPEVARQITSQISIPTLGIASGAECDGEIRVVHDVVGLFPWYQPPHAWKKGQIGEKIKESIQIFRDEFNL
ncbi:MAG: 3-methyl-2-oxobutanoate hydroxymethyltransferase [Verrucomicrobiae bacterium]|nr:3-methyl-2-oxobutanoate hydroxymethyltransferase [Verrucomicrobiae bacterium]